MKTTTKKTASKKVYNLVIVDESGSMGVIHHEALAGINETISTCKKMEKLHPEMRQKLTLISFDSDHFKVHYDNIDASEAHNLTMKDYCPSAATPLYDAIGRGIAKVNAQILRQNSAQALADDNVLVTIITDGEENCSEEYTLQMVKNLIEKLKKQGWTFTLIGTDNLDVEGMAGAMAIDNHLAFTEDVESTKRMFAKERSSRVRYNECCACDCAMPIGSYFQED